MHFALHSHGTKNCPVGPHPIHFAQMLNLKHVCNVALVENKLLYHFTRLFTCENMGASLTIEEVYVCEVWDGYICSLVPETITPCGRLVLVDTRQRAGAH